MKKLLLTSLAGILAVSTANAFEIAPYASVKGGWSYTNLSIEGDTLSIDYSEVGLSKSNYALVQNIADEVDVRLHTGGVWSVNPAIGAKMHFEDLSALSFRVEAEFAWNSNASKKISVPLGRNDAFGKASMKSLGVMANAYVDFETGCVVKPFITAGLGWGQDKLTVSYGTADFSDEFPTWKDSGLIWAVGGGLAFDVTENIAIDAEYRYLDQGSVDLSFAGLGSVDVKDIMHQFMVGVRYTF